MIFKAALASQRQPSWHYRALSFQTLRHRQFLDNSNSNFQFQGGKMFVCLVLHMTKRSVLSEQSVPLYSTNFPKCFENDILSQCADAFDTNFFSPFET